MKAGKAEKTKKELIVDGKNVLEPVDFNKNKKKIQEIRNGINTEVTLSHFKEKVGIFPANVKGDKMNEFVAQIQETFIEVNSSTLKINDQLDTIYSLIEKIHSGSIDGIVIAIQAAQKAIENADYAIEQLKASVEIIQGFKDSLDAVEHLDDVDEMWEKTNNLEEQFEQLEKDLNIRIKENASSINSLNKFKKKLETMAHLYDIDLMYDAIESNKDVAESKHEECVQLITEFKNGIDSSVDAMNALISENTSLIEENAERISEIDYRLKQIVHIDEVDEMWETQTLQKEEIIDLKHKLKVAYYLIAVVGSVLFLEIVLSILGIL